MVDVHAEATSEKMALGHLADGRASLVVGSHTHVPTADHQILPGGTAYITDVGMTGDYDSVIGMGKEMALQRFRSHVPGPRLTPALGEPTLVRGLRRDRRGRPRAADRAAADRRQAGAGDARWLATRAAWPASKRAPVSTGFMALLAAMSALAPMSLQIFVPALPAIQAHFAVSPGTAQLALSLSILANAIAALSYGPLSDRFGRRPVVLAGLVMFIAGSVLCALAPTIGVLIVGRIVQSGGGAAGMVIARAIVRDLYAREQAASMIAYLTMAMVVAPMLAPSVGALLLDLFDWRAIFVAVTGVGLAAGLAGAAAAARDPRRRLGRRRLERPFVRDGSAPALARVHRLRPAERVRDRRVLRLRRRRALLHDRHPGPPGDRVWPLVHRRLARVHGRQFRRRPGSAGGSVSIAWC